MTYYDWDSTEISQVPEKISIIEETLRDGLQAGILTQKPTIEQMQTFLEHAYVLGIRAANIGFPISQKETTTRLAKYISENLPNFEILCTGRTIENDVQAIVDISQAVGARLGAYLFVGTSSIRSRVERWSINEILMKIEESVRFATRNNLDVIVVTEDTTRSIPEVIINAYKTAIDAGASRICLADTVGIARPPMVRNIVKSVKQGIGNLDIQLEWHGHNDLGLATINAIEAILAGVNRVSVTSLGIGERAGNVATHQLVYNLYVLGLLNKTDIKLTELVQYSQYAASILGISIPQNEPIIGDSIFTTESGVHASAIIKVRAEKDGDLIYSGVSAQQLSRTQTIVVGPLSGKANVIYVLQQMGIPFAPEDVIEHILTSAKEKNRQLTNNEILTLYNNMVHNRTI